MQGKREAMVPYRHHKFLLRPCSYRRKRTVPNFELINMHMKNVPEEVKFEDSVYVDFFNA